MSAHGKLEIVLLHVFSVTEAGITALVENSPKLYLFKICVYKKVSNNEHIQLRISKDTLKKKLLYRKLFII